MFLTWFLIFSLDRDPKRQDLPFFEALTLKNNPSEAGEMLRSG